MRQAALFAMLIGLICTTGVIYPAVSQTRNLGEDARESLIQMRLRTNPDVFRLDKIPLLQNTRPIRVLVREGAFADFLAKRMLPSFTRRTGVEVTLETASDEELFKKQTRALAAANSTYDIISVDTGWVKEWSASGYTVPLQDLAAEFEPEGVEAFADFLSPYYDSLKEMLTYRGKLHALPYANYTMGLHYRRDLFRHPDEKANFLAEYGYALRPPRTLPELLDIARFFTRPPGEVLAGRVLEESFYGVILMAGATGNIKDELSALIWGLGGRWLRPVRHMRGNVQGYRVEVDDRIAANAFGAYLQLMTHAPLSAMEADWRIAADMFSNGRAAMWPFAYNDLWPVSATVENKVGGAKIDIAGVPMGRPYTGARALAVSYDSLNPEAAYWLVKHIVSYEGQLAYAFSGGNVCRRDVVLDPFFNMARRRHINGALAQNHDDMVRWGPQVRTVGSFTSTAIGHMNREMKPLIHDLTLGAVSQQEGLREMAETIHRLQNQFGEAPTLE